MSDLFSELKTCAKCNIEKSINDFYSKSSKCIFCSSLRYKNNKEEFKAKHSIYYQNNKERIKIRDTNNKEKLREKLKLYYQANKHIYKTKALKRYGLTQDEFNLILIEQNNSCYVCKTEFKTSYEAKIDHCHKKGKVRGILCNHCNIALGHVKDSIEILSKLIIYLKEKG